MPGQASSVFVEQNRYNQNPKKILQVGNRLGWIEDGGAVPVWAGEILFKSL